MPKFVDWNSSPKDTMKSKGKNSGLFLRLEDGVKYRLRLVSKAVEYHQHWSPIICRSPGFDEKNQPIDPLIQMGYEPQRRFAIWVLNRDNDNMLQIIDFPLSLLEKFMDWKNSFSEDPGGVAGPDFIVLVEKKPGKGKFKNSKEYRATAGPQTKFTEEELARIRQGITVGERQLSLKEALEHYRADDTPEAIREKLAEKMAAGGTIEPPNNAGYGKPSGVAAARPAPTAAAPSAYAAPAAAAPAPAPKAADPLFDF